jgi:hypothetical protein
MLDLIDHERRQLRENEFLNDSWPDLEITNFEQR